MSGKGQKRKAKNKQWYLKQEKRKKGGLNPGLKGFLLFCNKEERKAIREGQRFYFIRRSIPPPQSVTSGALCCLRNDGSFQTTFTQPLLYLG